MKVRLVNPFLSFNFLTRTLLQHFDYIPCFLESVALQPMTLFYLGVAETTGTLLFLCAKEL